MSNRGRIFGIVVCILPIELGWVIVPRPVFAGQPCRAEFVALGQLPKLTGATSTDCPGGPVFRGRPLLA